MQTIISRNFITKPARKNAEMAAKASAQQYR